MTMKSWQLGAAALLALSALPAQAQMATELWRLTGLASPESVAHDPASGTIYVSLMGSGDPMAKDGDGAIGTIGMDGKLINAAWVTGLNAPKGMAVVGGKLYVADVDTILEIDIATAAITNSFAVAGAVMLNDVASDAAGMVYASDTMTNTVHMVHDGMAMPFLSDPMLMGVNGLTVVDGTLYAADLGDLSGGFENIKPGPVVAIDLATKAMTAFGAEGPVGILDGVESDGMGNLLITDYMQGKVKRLAPGGMAEDVATLSLGSADLDYVADQKILLVPITPEGTVVALQMP